MLCEDDYGNKYMLKAVSNNVGSWNSEEVLWLLALPFSLSLYLQCTTQTINWIAFEHEGLNPDCSISRESSALTMRSSHASYSDITQSTIKLMDKALALKINYM